MKIPKRINYVLGKCLQKQKLHTNHRKVETHMRQIKLLLINVSHMSKTKILKKKIVHQKYIEKKDLHYPINCVIVKYKGRT